MKSTVAETVSDWIDGRFIFTSPQVHIYFYMAGSANTKFNSKRSPLRIHILVFEERDFTGVTFADGTGYPGIMSHRANSSVQSICCIMRMTRDYPFYWDRKTSGNFSDMFWFAISVSVAVCLLGMHPCDKHEWTAQSIKCQTNCNYKAWSIADFSDSTLSKFGCLLICIVNILEKSTQ